VTSRGKDEQRAFLLDLYRVAIEEYRFEVRLGWERAGHLLTLDSGLFAGSIGLLRLGGGVAGGPALLVAIVSLLGVAVSLLGIFTVISSRTYYERTKIKKSFLEERLGLLQPHPQHTSPLANLAVTTTTGMSDVTEILADPETWLARRRFRWWRRTITSYTGWLFVLLETAHVAVAAVVLANSRAARAPG
jgi:hypothetical protein